MPFTCQACGVGSAPQLIPAAGEVLRCPHCGDERPFVRPPLLIVTSPTAVGKSTLCDRLAGTIPGAVLLDADVQAEDLVSVVSPSHDYPAFWRSMMRLAHEIAQNGVAVVYFATMLPEQVLTNAALLSYFSSAHFLCLTCTDDVLRRRIADRNRSEADDAVLSAWSGFTAALLAAARELPTVNALDAAGPVDQLEQEVRRWLNAHLGRGA